jgi:GAF domain-containing protein
MVSPARPAGESERLDALRRYAILDTPPEEGFDRITRLASRWLDVPIALVTLLDENRQWFKSCVGLDVTETDREVAFCAYNVHGDGMMVVEDATADPRFADNPLVTGDPGIRFYAGAPLVTPEGHVLGSLCVIDTTPRSAGTMDLDVLRDLAGMVVTELELRATNDALRARNEQVRALSRELKAVQESDRFQLSQLLHEELSQTLQAARMTLENACGDVALSDEQAQRLVRVTDQLDDAVDLTRALTARFAPPVGNQPLHDTLEWLAQRMRTAHGLSVSVLGSESGAAPDASEALKTLLYRLVRELLFRIVRRTDPDAVRVHLIESTGHLRLTVAGAGEGSPNPIGNLDEVEGPLARLQTQLTALGVRLQVRSSPETGTCVTIAVPSAQQSAAAETEERPPAPHRSENETE